MTHANRFRLLAFCVLALTAACMNHPRNRSEIATPTSSFTFDGYVVDARETVTMTVKDQSTGSWDARTTAVSSTQGNFDGSFNWFQFTTSATLPFSSSSANRKYWRSTTNGSNGQRRIAADIVGTSPTRGDLFSFDVNADTCLNAQATGMNAANNCHSASSPIATVVTNCGKHNQVCCFANNIPAASRCDRSFSCDTTAKTCSIPVGGLQQPCSPIDNSCNNDSLMCLDGICHDIIHRAQIWSSQLVIHTCDSANAQTTSPKYVQLNSDYFYLDHGGMDTSARNTEDTWGIPIPSVNKISDIKYFNIGLTGGANVENDGWCFDRVDLVINGVRVFRKSFAGGVVLDWDNDQTDITVVLKEELRNAIDSANRTTVCALPTTITYTQIKRAVEGSLGDLFHRINADPPPPADSEYGHFDAWWGNNGATVTRSGGGVKLALAFRVKSEEPRDAANNPLIDTPEFEANAEIDLQASVSCESTAVGSGSSISQSQADECSTDFDSSVDVTRVHAEADTPIPLVGDAVEWIAQGAVATAAYRAIANVASYNALFDTAEDVFCDRAHELSVTLCDPEGDLCECPGLTVGASSLGFNWTPLKLNLVPNPLCQM